MIEAGLIVGIALLFTMSKMTWWWKLRILSNPLLMDLLVFALLTVLHWGTFTGVMAATIGAMVCSMVLSAGRYTFGYMKDGDYVPGRIDVTDKLIKE